MENVTPEQLYQVYYSRVYQRIYGLIGHREQAEDLTQDVFVKAIRALPTLHSTDNLSGWLYRIATNTTYDALRRRKLVGWQSLLSEDAFPLQQADIQECYPTQEAVRHTLECLPLAYQRALVLTILQGYSLHEVATLVGVSPKGAKMYLKRARQAFRECYAKEAS